MEDTLDDTLITLCVQYIEDKDCHYIAKEGQVVRYFSVTGRKSDYVWHKASISETLRIIRAMRCSVTMAQELKEHHLIAGFQELERVYEFAMKSRFPVKEGIFNYSEHAEVSLADEAMGLLAETLLQLSYTAVLLNPVKDLIAAINLKLKIDMTPTETRDCMYKHFESMGYVIKTGPHRPLVQGRKQAAIMLPSEKPASVVDINSVAFKRIVAKIYGELI